MPTFYGILTYLLFGIFLLLVSFIAGEYYYRYLVKDADDE